MLIQQYRQRETGMNLRLAVVGRFLIVRRAAARTIRKRSNLRQRSRIHAGLPLSRWLLNASIQVAVERQAVLV